MADLRGGTTIAGYQAVHAGNMNVDTVGAVIIPPADAVVSSTANQYNVSIAGVSSYVDMLPLRLRFTTASSGAVSINVNGLGAKAVIDYYQQAVTDIQAGTIVSVCFNASTGNFQLQGKGGGGNATSDKLLTGYSATTNAGKINGSMVDNPSLVSAVSVGTNGTNKYFRIPYGAYLHNNGSGYPEIVAGATQIDTSIVTGNIKSGASICGVSGKASVVDTSDASCVPAYLLVGQSGYANGSKVNGSMVNRQVTGDDFFNSSYPNLTINKGLNIQFGTYGTSSPAKRLVIAPPTGYYPGGGSAYVSMEQSDVANVIGLTADKMLATQSVCGVTGSVPVRSDTGGNGGSTRWWSAYGVAYSGGKFHLRPCPSDGSATLAYKGDCWVTAEQADVASNIGLTADRIVSGNTILGIAGSATVRSLGGTETFAVEADVTNITSYTFTTQSFGWFYDCMVRAVDTSGKYVGCFVRLNSLVYINMYIKAGATVYWDMVSDNSDNQITINFPSSFSGHLKLMLFNT